MTTVTIAHASLPPGQTADVPQSVYENVLQALGWTLVGTPPTSETAGIALPSSYAGGDNTFDSTSRITLQSHQKAVHPNHYGEGIRLDLKQNGAKAMIAWRDDYSGSGPRTIAWVGAHGQSNDGASWHNHLSFEVPDTNGALQTALEIPFAQWNSANGVGISPSDAYVRAAAKLIAGGVPLIVEGPAGSIRDLHLGTTDGTNVGGKDAFRRWSVRADSAAEAGSNAGTDLQIIRRTDAGAVIDTALFIKRSTGQVGLGGVTSPTTALDIGPGSSTVSTRVNRGANTSFLASYVLATSGTDRWAVQIRNDSTEDLHVRNSAQGHTALLVENRATAPNVSLLTSTKSYGGGVGVVYVANASTVPTTNPSGGGVLFAEGGALKWRGSSGTVTTIAPA